MAVNDHQKELILIMREIQSHSPEVNFDSEHVSEYASTVEERIGTTNSYDMAGYILPNGKLLDASVNNVFSDNTRVIGHMDVKFYGFKDNELVKSGIIKYGECPVNNIPFVEISLEYMFPTKEQLDVLDDILSKSPNELDVEVKLNDNTEDKIHNGFYKRYSFITNGDTADTIKQDILRYKNGDRTYAGYYDEFYGDVFRP